MARFGGFLQIRATYNGRVAGARYLGDVMGLSSDPGHAFWETQSLIPNFDVLAGVFA